MKRNILILFAVVSLLISFTGCGGSGSSNSAAPAPTAMTSVRISLTQNGETVTGAEAALYTPDAAMREGLTQAQNNALLRASIGENLEGVYKPTSTSADGTYTFTVPTGEYTLIADKGDSRAVVTNLRAAASSVSEEQEGAALKYELTPTGTINGKVISNVTGLSVAGVIVYLNGTSFAAITKSDGSFSISGVPQDTFNISAVSNQNGKTYASSLKQLVMGSDLVKNDVEVVLAEASGTKTYKITGSITGNDKANKVIMASNGSNLFVVTSKENGSFEIAVNTKGKYSVTCFGATEEIKTIDVTNDTNSLSDSFEVNKSAEGYGTVIGNIKFSSSFYGRYHDSNTQQLDVYQGPKMPDVDRYLIRLIGVGTTYYRTSTKADYIYINPSENRTFTIDDTVATFSFDSVPPGDYVLFVDPAGNGFFGACGNISVLKDKQTRTPDVEVEYVKPDFFVSPNSQGTIFIENYPFISTDTDSYTTISFRKIGGYESEILTLGSGSGFGDYPLLLNDENYVLNSNGKYEFTVQRVWSDSNTGLKGTLTGTYVVENSANTNSIGNFTVYRPMDSNNPVSGGTTTGVIVDTNTDSGILKYSDNTISCFNLSNNSEFGNIYEYKDAETDRENDFTRVELNFWGGDQSAADVSGQYAVYDNQDTTAPTNYYIEKLYFYDDKKAGSTQADKSQIIDEKPDSDNSNYYYFTSGSIIHNSTSKYIAYILYKASSDDSNGTEIIRFVDLSNPTNKVDITSSSSGDYTTPKYVRLNLSKDGTPYLLVLYRIELQDADNCLIRIYDCSNPSSPSNPVVEYELNVYPNRASDFRVLEDGSFYVELNDFCFDDYYPENAYYTAMRFRANSNAPIETSKLGTRKSCFMDKYGFMYRFDVTTKSIIKTASLDGEALETYNPNRITEGIMGSTEPVDSEPLIGILGLDGSTLYAY